jgi:hypothetical protein
MMTEPSAFQKILGLVAEYAPAVAATIANPVGGGMLLAGKILQGVTGATGSLEDQAALVLGSPELQVQLKTAVLEHALAMEQEKTKQLQAEAEADKENVTALNERVIQMEGTASDLRAIPVLGSIMLFIRGSQRPVWGFATLFIDYQVFSKAWEMPAGDPRSAAFTALNLLVLGFLFGERAVKNVMPLIIEFFKQKAA